MTVQQLSAFTVEPSGRVRMSDPVQSVNAARTITGRTESLILELMADGRARTADEVAAELDCYGPTAVSAFSRLKGHRLIKETGEQRETRQHRLAAVYRIDRTED